jgi:hypothetical protein
VGENDPSRGAAVSSTESPSRFYVICHIITDLHRFLHSKFPYHPAFR